MVMQKLAQTEIGLEDRSRMEVGKILNRILADESVLLAATKHFHWNVTGPHFGALHIFFEQQYQLLNQIVDDVAERVRALGEKSLGTLSEFLNVTTLQERNGDYSAEDMIRYLEEDHEQIIRNLRKDLEECDDYGDMGTDNFLTDLMERHEKMSWMLRAHLE